MLRCLVKFKQSLNEFSLKMTNRPCQSIMKLNIIKYWGKSDEKNYRTAKNTEQARECHKVCLWHPNTKKKAEGNAWMNLTWGYPMTKAWRLQRNLTHGRSCDQFMRHMGWAISNLISFLFNIQNNENLTESVHTNLWCISAVYIPFLG